MGRKLMVVIFSIIIVKSISFVRDEVVSRIIVFPTKNCCMKLAKDISIFNTTDTKNFSFRFGVDNLRKNLERTSKVCLLNFVFFSKNEFSSIRYCGIGRLQNITEIS